MDLNFGGTRPTAISVGRVPRRARLNGADPACYDREASRKVPPLQGSDSSPDDQLVDFPLRDADAHGADAQRSDPPEWVQPLVASVPPAPAAIADDRQLFASSIEEPRRRSGISTWLIVASSVVVGILIGFASGYQAARAPMAGGAEGEQGTPAAPTSGATAGKPFSESTVDGPVRLEEQPVVPAPDPSAPKPAGSAPKPAGSAPESDPRGTRPTEPGTRPTESRARPTVPSKSAVGRVPPTVDAPRGGPAALPPATGPGSLQVLSRPAGAQVFLDGRVVGTTPLTIPDVSAGRHDIRLELPGFNRWATTVEVSAGTPARVAASLEQ